MLNYAPPAPLLLDVGSTHSDQLPLATIRGLRQVLDFLPLLRSLAARSGQLGAVDYLEYFLTNPYVGTKTPCLFLVGRSGSLNDSASAADHLYGAVLMYEYRILGFGTKVYTTDDDGGERTVIAAPSARPWIAGRVAGTLIREGARMVLITLRAEGQSTIEALRSSSSCERSSPLWTTRERQMQRSLVLGTTYDETLATMGKHTRRNLRAFRRRAEAELGTTFVPNAEVSREEFLTLNLICSYPVPDHVAGWRYETAARLDGGFTTGVKSSDGRWLSLLGGRRHHGTTEVAWQMNREDLAEFSLCTVMRSYLLEHEVALGMGKLSFEGGTPHSMQSAFTSETVVDLLACNRSLPANLLRRYAPRFLPPKNIVSQMLSSPDTVWRS